MQVTDITIQSFDISKDTTPSKLAAEKDVDITNNAASKKKIFVNMDGHVGLRGFLSLYIVAFHAILFSVGWDLLGTPQMGIFFLLSGFSLSVVYGDSSISYLASVTCCVTSKKRADDSSAVAFDTNKFRKNRFARLLPVYFLTNIIAILPLVLFSSVDTTSIIWRSADVFTGWGVFSGFGAAAPNAPSWTVQVLAFFYWRFPVILAKFNNLSDVEMGRRVVKAFWYQLLAGLVAVIIALVVNSATSSQFPSVLWLSTAHPLVRIQLFVSGCYAGLLCSRYKDAPMPKSVDHCFSWTVLPFLSSAVEPSSSAPENSVPDTASFRPAPEQDVEAVAGDAPPVGLDGEYSVWARRVDANAAVFYGACAVFGLLSVMGVDTHADIFLSLLSAYSLLVIVVGLTRDGGQSRTSYLLNRACPQLSSFLGRISYSLYLVHYVVMLYINLIAGKNGMVDSQKAVPFVLWGDESYREHSQGDHYFTPRGIPFLFMFSIGLAFVIEKWFEAPLRQVMRSKQ